MIEAYIDFGNAHKRKKMLHSKIQCVCNKQHDRYLTNKYNFIMHITNNLSIFIGN